MAEDALDDERAIREVVETWMAASRAGDVAGILELMTDDAVFMVPGREPFGREAFAALANASGEATIEATGEIVELRVLGEWAFLRNRIEMTMTPAEGRPVRRSGYTLTLMRNEADGRWRLARDANLLTIEG